MTRPGWELMWETVPLLVAVQNPFRVVTKIQLPAMGLALPSVTMTRHNITKETYPQSIADHTTVSTTHTVHIWNQPKVTYHECFEG